jgi:cell wall-associated NlpC family hydrolase
MPRAVLNVFDNTMNKRSLALALSAKGCLGTPFYHQGRVAGVGLDCIGLVIHALQSTGMMIADQQEYGREPEGKKLHTALIAHGFEPVTDIHCGDIILFRFNGQPQHVGLAISARTMVHSYAPIGRVVETSLGETWLRRIAGIYRHPSYEEMI